MNYSINQFVATTSDMALTILVGVFTSSITLITYFLTYPKYKRKLYCVIVLLPIMVFSSLLFTFKARMLYSPSTVNIKERTGTFLYFGSKNAEIPVGEGRIFDNQGNLVYKGSFVLDKQNNILFHGQGELYALVESNNPTTNSSIEVIYSGGWQYGLKHGLGKEYNYSIERTFGKNVNVNPYLIYEGDYAEGKFNGRGTEYGLGYKYTGYFVKGKVYGYGERISISEEGEFEKLVGEHGIKGKAKAYKDDDSIYIEGDTNGVSFDGDVKMYYDYSNDIVYYEGSMDKNKKSGYGTLYYTNKNIKYVGFFSDDLFNDQGKLFYENGNLQYDGIWKKGKRQDKGTSFHENGNIKYTGEWSDDNYNGKGKLYRSDGTLEFDSK